MIGEILAYSLTAIIGAILGYLLHVYKSSLHTKKSTKNNTHLRNLADPTGQHRSPILKDGVKNYLIDIDGTICDDIPNEEPERMADAGLYPGALETINKRYNQGHIITFFTSRTEAHRSVTESWLAKHGFQYHSILMNKPRGGNYHRIDNHIVRATRYEGVFDEMITTQATIEVFPEHLAK